LIKGLSSCALHLSSANRNGDDVFRGFLDTLSDETGSVLMCVPALYSGYIIYSPGFVE